jgi:hypothetical protein
VICSTERYSTPCLDEGSVDGRHVTADFWKLQDFGVRHPSAMIEGFVGELLYVNADFSASSLELRAWLGFPLMASNIILASYGLGSNTWSSNEPDWTCACRLDIGVEAAMVS